MRTLASSLAICVIAAVVTAGIAEADPSDDAIYGRLAADAHAQGIPGGTTQIGTLAESVCAARDGSTSITDIKALLQEGAPLAWALLQSWTNVQVKTFFRLVVADGYCG